MKLGDFGYAKNLEIEAEDKNYSNMLTIIIDREPSSNYATPGYNPPEYKT